ncbi:4-hydroxy-tetrahydrodipicolinate synthase [Bacillus cereus]|nr:4-hydroxy-tetrahydrodipicolinate synthase [Bacillus cereus]
MKMKGCYVALITPFDDKGKVDYKRLEKLVDLHVEWGTRGLIPLGTTGETPTLTEEEYKNIAKTVVEHSNKRIPVFIGTGSNDTKKTIRNIEFANTIQASGSLVVLPYYNKPSQNGIIEHFKILDQIGSPLIIYNIPGRTGVNLEPETLSFLLENTNNLIGIKESSGDLDQISKFVSISQDYNFSVLSGDDSLTLPTLAVGGTGVISVLGNVLPSMIQEMINKYSSGDIQSACKIHHSTFNLSKALLEVGSNPAPVKEVMNMLGYKVGGTRLPLVNLNSKEQLILKELIQKLKLFK